MLTISRALNAATIVSYHSKEFSNTDHVCLSQRREVQSEWAGGLADEWDLQGPITKEQFKRAAYGQHPMTGEQLVRSRPSTEYKNCNGKIIKSMSHRAAWDATFNAPKTASLSALVGGDERIIQAHRESVAVALKELERFVEARTRPVQVSGRWLAAKFEHDSSRPVDGYPAPHLHTHIVFFNLTKANDGKIHAIQELEVFRSRGYATAIYRAELAYRLKQIGYRLEIGKTGAPEIKGYAPEYVQASSPRKQQIVRHLQAGGLKGRRAAQIACYRTREKKVRRGAVEILEQHRTLAAEFGNQPYRVVEQTRSHASYHIPLDTAQRSVQEAVTYSLNHHAKFKEIADERDVLRVALWHSTGYSRFQELRENVEARIRSGEFIEVHQERDAFVARVLAVGAQYERDNLVQVKREEKKCELPCRPGRQQQPVDVSMAKGLAGERSISNRHIAVHHYGAERERQAGGVTRIRPGNEPLLSATSSWTGKQRLIAQDNRFRRDIYQRTDSDLKSINRGKLHEPEPNLTRPHSQELNFLLGFHYDAGDSMTSEPNCKLFGNTTSETDENPHSRSFDLKHGRAKRQDRKQESLQQEYSMD